MSKKFLSPIKLAQGASNPSSGSAGEIFYNTTDKAIYTHNGTGWGVTESSIPAGTMVQWGGSTAPTNWLLCDGTAVSRTTYATLFAAIGTSYGVGDGSTTFNLPDLRGRVPVGKNAGTFATLGATGGTETVTLAVTNLPSHTHTGTTATSGNHTHTYSGSTNTTGAHTHTLSGSNGGAVNLGPSVTSNSNGDFGYLLNGGRANSAGDHSHTFSGTTSDVSTTHTHTFTTDATGSGTAINNLQPYQVVNYIIKTTSGTTAGDSPLTARVSAIETTTVRSVALGGTGASTLTGYVKGSGTTALTASSTIPGSDISGNISGNAANVTGTVAVANGGTGATTGAGLVPIIPTGGTYGSVSANGLITFTTGVRADGIFTSNYDSYRIILNVTSASASDYLYFRFCTGGTANSTSSYYNGSMFTQSGTVASWSNGNNVNSYSGRVGYFLNDGATSAIFDIHGPFGTATKTNTLFQSKYSATGVTSITGGVVFNGTTSFDGILFGGEAGSGQPNGTMQVLGYRK